MVKLKQCRKKKKKKTTTKKQRRELRQEKAFKYLTCWKCKTCSPIEWAKSKHWRIIKCPSCNLIGWTKREDWYTIEYSSYPKVSPD